MEPFFGSVTGRLFDLEGLGAGAGQFSKLEAETHSPFTVFSPIRFSGNTIISLDK
jgi:hypothetical protein